MKPDCTSSETVIWKLTHHVFVEYLRSVGVFPHTSNPSLQIQDKFCMRIFPKKKFVPSFLIVLLKKTLKNVYTLGVFGVILLYKWIGASIPFFLYRVKEFVCLKRMRSNFYMHFPTHPYGMYSIHIKAKKEF